VCAALATIGEDGRDGLTFQLGIERDFATGEEGISVNVQNAVVWPVHGQKRRRW